MDNQSNIQVWIVNGQLLTNRPHVFVKNFDLPKTAPVDGLTRVSHGLGKITTRTKTRDNGTGAQYHSGLQMLDDSEE